MKKKSLFMLAGVLLVIGAALITAGLKQPIDADEPLRASSYITAEAKQAATRDTKIFIYLGSLSVVGASGAVFLGIFL